MDVNQIFFVGHNKYGQAGIGQEEHNKKFIKPKQIIFKTFIKQVSCGNHHSALLTIDGLIYTMGSNIHGTLGLDNGNSINYSFKPTLVKQLKDVDQIFSGSHHMCALKQGELYSWGKGIDGQLGHGNMKNVFVPTKIIALGNDVQSVSCGTNHTLVLINKQKSQLNGYAFGSGIYGQLGNGTNKSYNYPVNIKLSNIQQISAGQNHSLFVSENKLYGCGDNSYNQIGGVVDSPKNKKYILQPTKLDLQFDFQISLISTHTISALMSSQSQVYVWGGKNKTWPPSRIDEQNIINIKSRGQKLYILNQQNQIISLTSTSTSTSNKTSSYNQISQLNFTKQRIIQNKNVLDFDAGQNHILAIGDIVAQTEFKQDPSILSVWQGQSLASSKHKYSQKNILASKSQQLNYQNIQNKRINQQSNQSMQQQQSSSSQNNQNFTQDHHNAIIKPTQIQQQRKLSDYFFTKHLYSGKSSLNRFSPKQNDIDNNEISNIQSMNQTSHQQQYGCQYECQQIQQQQNQYQTTTFYNNNNHNNENNQSLPISQSNQTQSHSHSNSNAYTNKYSQNISSQIEIQQRYQIHVNNTQQKRSLQQFKDIKQTINNNAFLSTKDFYPNGQIFNKQEFNKLVMDIDICNSQKQMKLQRLMNQMEEKTVHLKKKHYYQKDNNCSSSNNNINIHARQYKQPTQQTRTMFKTPSSYIKKQPQKFIIQSGQLVKCSSFHIDPSIQNTQNSKNRQNTSSNVSPNNKNYNNGNNNNNGNGNGKFTFQKEIILKQLKQLNLNVDRQTQQKKEILKNQLKEKQSTGPQYKKKTKSIIYYHENSCLNEEQINNNKNNHIASIALPISNTKLKQQTIMNQISQNIQNLNPKKSFIDQGHADPKKTKKQKHNQSIESIFKKLLRKHHKQKINLNIQQNSLKLSINQNNGVLQQKEKCQEKSRSRMHTQKTSLTSTSVDKFRNLSMSGISSKFTQIQTSRLQKHSTQTINQLFLNQNTPNQQTIFKNLSKQKQLPASQTKSQLQITSSQLSSFSPYKQKKLSLSKLSSHSNKSILMRNKNHDLLQISRSNRQLRGELRDRNLKISKLQEDLSRKEMEIIKLKKLLEKNGIKEYD